MAEERNRDFEQWQEHDRFTYPHCYGCQHYLDAEPGFLHDLFAVQGDIPIMRLCKRCRRRWSRTSSGRLQNPFGYTLRLFRDEVKRRHPQAEIVIYHPAPTGLQPRPFTIDDDE